MKYKIFLLYALLPLCLCSLTANSLHGNTVNTKQNTENIKDVIYIDVNIDQPNVEDCYDDDTSIFDLSKQDWLKIFPNPNEGVFSVEIQNTTDDKTIDVLVFNSIGKKVYQSSHDSPGGYLIIDLNLSGLPKGVYYLRVQANTRFGVEQLIIF